MRENRKINRRSLGKDYSSDIKVDGKIIKVQVLDVSYGGMRILVSEFLSPESDVYCKIDIFPGMKPFYVKGYVQRVLKSNDKWEIGVKFDLVRIHDFFDMEKDGTGGNGENGNAKTD